MRPSGYTDYPTGAPPSYVGSRGGYYGYQESGPSGYLERNYPSYANGGPPEDGIYGGGPPGEGASVGDAGFPSVRYLDPFGYQGPQGPPVPKDYKVLIMKEQMIQLQQLTLQA